MPENLFVTAKEFASLGGSMLALSSTLYFWLVRSNGEKPNLEVFALKPPEGHVLLPQQSPRGFYKFAPNDDDVCAMYWLDLAVVNNSTLPNAVIGLQVHMRRASGEWQEAMVTTSEDAPLPLNMTPLTTQGMKLSIALPIEGPLGSTDADRSRQAIDALAAPTQICVRLQGLKNRAFEFCLTDTKAQKAPATELADAA